MYDDLAVLLSAFRVDAPRDAYRKAVVEENTLGKRTASTRKYTFQRLSEIYGLNPDITIFRLLRRYWEADDGTGRRIMAVLCALARDPILRMTADPVLGLAQGERFEKESLERAVEEAAPGRFSPVSLAKISRLAGSSWTQAGLLGGRYNKVRTQPTSTPPAAAYALALGCLSGAQSIQAFDTLWTRVLGTPPDALHRLAQEASRRGLLRYRNAGGIVELSFNNVLTSDEQERLHEQA